MPFSFRKVASGNQALFGIVQGGIYPDLRQASAESLMNLGFPGYAIGGLAVGEPNEVMYEVIDRLEPHLPEDRPRYLMGVGTPENLMECVALGIDMFDCVMPTRHARNGSLFTRDGQISIKNARYKEDPNPSIPIVDVPYVKPIPVLTSAIYSWQKRYWHRCSTRCTTCTSTLTPCAE
jgi:queuine tRNA-ribosyltransferase